MKKSTRYLAIFEMATAALLWGFGFIATVWALKSLSSPAIIFYRFFGAFIIGMLLLFIGRVQWSTMKQEALLSFIPGIALWLLLIFQTIGLETTTATNSGFITTLYVIWVPLFRYIVNREHMGKIYWLSVLMAMVGTICILNWNSFDVDHLNIGDFLTLIASFMAAAHIIIVGKRAPLSQNDFAFNIFQSLWVALPCLLIFVLPQKESLSFFFGNWDLHKLDEMGWIGMVALTLGSSLIAFFLQVRAQKTLSPSTASLLFLLESPVACFFAFWLLGERLNSLQIIGAILILAACVLISVPSGTRSYFWKRCFQK